MAGRMPEGTWVSRGAEGGGEPWKETPVSAELNSTGWKGRSGPSWPRKGEPHIQLFRLHTWHWGSREMVSGGR